MSACKVSVKGPDLICNREAVPKWKCGNEFVNQ